MPNQPAIASASPGGYQGLVSGPRVARWTQDRPDLVDRQAPVHIGRHTSARVDGPERGTVLLPARIEIDRRDLVVDGQDGECQPDRIAFRRKVVVVEHRPARHQMSKTSRAERARDTQGVMQVFEALLGAATDRTSLWSGSPSRTVTRQVPQAPWLQEVGMSTPCSASTSTIVRSAGTLTVRADRARATSKVEPASRTRVLAKCSTWTRASGHPAAAAAEHAAAIIGAGPADVEPVAGARLAQDRREP